jgi:hypothetical protein
LRYSDARKRSTYDPNALSGMSPNHSIGTGKVLGPDAAL